MRRLAALLLLLLALPRGAAAQEAHAQSPQGVGGDEPYDYPYIFPILGQKLAKRGIHLPLPWGVSIGYVYSRQRIQISDLQLGVPDGELQDVEFIQFDDESNVELHAVNTRLDLWVLPMIGLSAIVNYAPVGRTSVKFEDPFQDVEAGKDLSALGYGFGAILGGGYKGVIATADVNFTWQQIAGLDQPTFVVVSGLRVGYHADLRKGWSLSTWGGAMYQQFGGTSTGTVRFNEVLPEPDIDGMHDSCDTVGIVFRPPCNNLVDRVEEGYDEGAITFSISKRPLNHWSPQVGAQVGYGEHWFYRVEVSLFVKWQVIAMVNYRFGIRRKGAGKEGAEEGVPLVEPTGS